MAAKHHTDLVLCRRLPGVAVGMLCDKCEGRCVICDSFVRPEKVVRVCEEHNYGAQKGRCVVCNGEGVEEAFYCKECCQQEKDRDGCPKVVNVTSSRKDWHFENKKFGFANRGR